MDTQSFQDVPKTIPITSDDRGHIRIEYMEIIAYCINK